MEASAKATDNVDDKVEALDRSLKKIPPDAAKASAAMKLLGDDTGKAALKLQDFGRSSTSMGLLDQHIEHTRGELRRLADEFDRTGDSGTLQRLFRTGDELKDLERFKKRLVSWAGDAGKQGGQEFAKNLSASSQGALSMPVAGPAIAALIVGAVAAALPVVNGLLLGAAGLGGIGLGIAGQFRDPQVKAAIGDMGHTLMAELQRDTMAFKQPLIDSAGLFGDALGRALRSIDFGRLSQLLVPLASGVGGLFTGMMPGFNHALEAAEPVIRALAQELPEVGRALSDMFDSFARGGPGATEALRTALMLLEGMLRMVGLVTEAFSGVYHEVVRVEDNVANLVDGFAHAVPVLGALADKTKAFLDHIRYGSTDVAQLGRSLREVGESGLQTVGDLERTADAWKDVNAGLSLVAQTATALPMVLDGVSHAMHGTAIGMVSDLDKVDITLNQMTGQLEQQVFGAIMGVAQANIAWHQSLLGVNEAVKQNGTTLKDNTKEGLANQLAILGMVQGNQQLYQANIASGMSADQARQVYEQNHDTMVRGAVAAGFNAGQVHGLTDAYRAVPATAQTEIIAKGLRSVLDAINDLIWQLALLNGKSATVDVYYRTHGMPAPSSGSSQLNFMAGGGIRKAQVGLVIPPSDPGTVLVGEPQTGGEVLIPMRGARDPVGLMRAAGAGYGLDVVPRGWGMGGGGRASVTTINVTVNAGLGTNGADVGRQIADRLRPFISSHGGNVQAALGRRGQ
jgi:hypothetical protein